MASMPGSNSYGFPEGMGVDMSGGGWQYPPIDPLEMARAGQQGLQAYPGQGSYEYFLAQNMQNMQTMRIGPDPALAQAPLALTGLQAGGPIYPGSAHMAPRSLFGDNRGAMMDTRSNAPQGPRGYYGGHGGSYGGSRDGGHGSSRRQGTEINVNKAITKKLASAVHYQRVSQFPDILLQRRIDMYNKIA